MGHILFESHKLREFGLFKQGAKTMGDMDVHELGTRNQGFQDTAGRFHVMVKIWVFS